MRIQQINFEKFDLNEIDDVPVRAGLRAVSRFDSLWESDEHKQDFFEFCRCQFLREHEVILTLPTKETADSSVFHIWQEIADEDSDTAFKSANFREMYPHLFEFDAEAYHFKQVLERIKQFAISHSIHFKSRPEVAERFKEMAISWIEQEFAFPYAELERRFKNSDPTTNRTHILLKMDNIKKKWKKAVSVWNRYAFWD